MNKYEDTLSEIIVENEIPYLRDHKNNILNVIDNYIMYLEKSKRYSGKLKFNDFLQRKEIEGEEFTDADLNILYNNIERDATLTTRTKIDSALSEVFSKNKYNPVVEYLDSLKWDGKERISNMFIDLLEADDNKVIKEMTKKWFIAAVKRVYEPGCKFDNILVLQGNQGIGKSTICERISRSFFNTISLNEIGTKDLVDKLNKTWIAIIDELDTFNKKEMSTIKTFLSLSSDSTRLAYARNAQSFKRHCVFIGSTNDETFLRDTTSSVERRFWIVKCNKTSMDSKISDTLTPDYIAQLWAEAKFYYKQNTNQYLDIDYSLQEEFSKMQREFKVYNDDPIVDYAYDILNKKYYLDEKGCFSSSEDLLSQYSDNRMYDDTKCSYITRIPISYLIHVLSTKYHVKVTNKYLCQMLSDEWDYKVIKYLDNKPYRGLIRKSAEEKNEELF